MDFVELWVIFGMGKQQQNPSHFSFCVYINDKKRIWERKTKEERSYCSVERWEVVFLEKNCLSLNGSSEDYLQCVFVTKLRLLTTMVHCRHVEHRPKEHGLLAKLDSCMRGCMRCCMQVVHAMLGRRFWWLGQLKREQLQLGRFCGLV